MIENKLDNIFSNTPEYIKRFVDRQGEIALQIISILKNKRIKQKEIAEKLNMRESQLSKILSGEANITIKTIAKIETVLGEEIIHVPIFKDTLYNSRGYFDMQYSQKECTVFDLNTEKPTHFKSDTDQFNFKRVAL